MAVASDLSLTVPAEVAEICRRNGFKELSLFGSFARGEQRADSDVDLLYELLPGVRFGLFRLEGIRLELEEVFGRKVDLGSKRSLKPLIRDRVLAEARPIYEG